MAVSKQSQYSLVDKFTLLKNLTICYLCLCLTEQYDAQIANLSFDSDLESGAILSSESRIAFGSMGPMAAGDLISCSLYFKTIDSNEVVLIFYGDKWGITKTKHLFLLTLNEGTPNFYINQGTFAAPVEALALNDGDWHNIIISMPSKSCLLSEVLMYVDGRRIHTQISGNDDNIFYTTSGHLSLGGWGYSSDEFGQNIFDYISNFNGEMDDFQVWHDRVLRPPTPETDYPTLSPSLRPTKKQTNTPTSSPTTKSPSQLPTKFPTRSPSKSPTPPPTQHPTEHPTKNNKIRIPPVTSPPSLLSSLQPSQSSHGSAPEETSSGNTVKSAKILQTITLISTLTLIMQWL